MQLVPLQPIAAQTLTLTLNNQLCVITVRQRTTGIFVDLTVGGVVVMTSVLGRHRVRMVREAYLGFVGDLAFVDTQGTSDPDSSGFGTRWLLFYLTPADVAGYVL